MSAHQPFVAVYAGQRCLGHVIMHPKQGFEAFDWNDVSVGIYPTQGQAADALTIAMRTEAEARAAARGD